MKIQKIKQIVLIFAIVAVLVFLGLAYEGKAGIALFNNTSQQETTPPADQPITHIISNLTRPAEVEITEEDMRRIPKVEGVVQTNGNENSSEYEEIILETFLCTAEQLSGAGTKMGTYRIETFDLLTDPDFADPLFLGKERGVKVTIALNNTPSVLENTHWGYLIDASAIAHDIYQSTAGPDTGYVTISYTCEGKGSPQFQVSLNARDANAYMNQWTDDTYLPLAAWSAKTVDSSADIVPYEDLETSIASGNSDSLSSDAPSTCSATAEYNLYVSKNDLKDLMSTYSVEMQNHIKTISDHSSDSDFRGMADAAEEMVSRATDIEDEILELPINPQYCEVTDTFLEGLRHYRTAGTYFWYGATFTETEPIITGNSYVQQGFSKNNEALKAFDLKTITTDVMEVPSGDLYPNALYMYENVVYPDKYGRNDISVKFSSMSSTNMYTLKQDGESEKNVAGYGYKYVFPVIEAHHMGYRGSGSSRITTPEADDFTILYNGEEYQSITPSPYVGRTLDVTTCVDPAGHPYYKMTLDRKEEVEGILVFKVPHDFDPAKAYMILTLDEEDAVWHMVPR